VALILRRRPDAERDGHRIYAVVQDLLDACAPVPHDAAPASGLIEAALALYHRVRPTDLHVARPWIHADASPRRAVVQLDNGHALLEEHPASADAEAGGPGALLRWETEAILLSAADRAGLADRARELIDWLEDHPDAVLKDIAYTLTVCSEGGDSCRAGGVSPLSSIGRQPPISRSGRAGGVSPLSSRPDRGLTPPARLSEPDEEAQPKGVRLGLVVSSTADLSSRLAALLPRLDGPSGHPLGDGRGTYYWDQPLGDAGGLAFLFPGEGSQYAGMLADLCVHFPEVRRLFDTSDRIAQEQGDAVAPSEYLFGQPDQADAELWSATTAVNVVLSAQWALYQVLTRLGLQPDAVAGHSSGELLALAAAGVLDADRHLECQLGVLGTIFRGLESAGDVPSARLVAVAAGRDRVEAACLAVGAAGVMVAIDNCPHQVVVAGPPDEVERVVLRLRGENVLLEDLPFQRAYHTPAFAPVLGPVAAFFEGLNFRTARVPVYSCATRGRMPDEPEAIRDLAVAQWTRPVAFRETIEAMHADGLRIFVDVGARGNLAGFVQDTLRGRPAFAIATNLPRRSGLTQLNHLVAALFAHGVSIRPHYLYARRRPRRIDALALSRGMVPVGCSVSTEPSPGIRIDWCNGDTLLPDDPASSPSAMEASLHPRWSSEPAPLPPADRFHLGDGEPDGPELSEVDATMLTFQETMRAFLETQQAVIGAYLGSSPSDIGARRAPYEPSSHDIPVATTSGPEPGPWIGEVRRLVPGSEIEAVTILDASTDPIAEHHTLGGRRVSALDPSLKGLPVLPFAVMAEMVAQAGALVVPPGLVLTKLAQLNAHKWVRYEDEPVVLELRGRHEPSPEPGEHRVRVALFNRGPGGRAEASRPVFEAVAIFAGAAEPPPLSMPWSLADPRPSRFTAESLYGEQWLFHGPAFQALIEVGHYSGSGIDGVLRVLPWEPLLPPGRSARLHTDLIVLDNFTHLLGCWGLDDLADHGDVIFPLRMEELELFGDRPVVGTDVACRIAIEEVQRHRVRVSAEIVRPDGTVWMRLRDWEDWRFHWPSRYRDVFRQPQDIFVGEEWPLETSDSSVRAVWLEPPADMGRPVWRDVLEQTQLGPEELAEHLAMGGTEETRSRRLWGRVAAKEAARRLWRDVGRGPTYPADLAIVTGERGRPVLIRIDDPRDRSLPSIAIADAEGVAVAIAARDPQIRPGIAVASIPGESAFTPGEQAALARWPDPKKAEWAARFRCAREAAIKASGAGSATSSQPAEVVRVDESSGAILVRIAATDAPLIRVTTGRRGEYAWAWTLGEGVEP
jgi:malonyl CoA-acyl carrier protein transacylase